MSDCTIIILGASGDLAKRKLIPALYELARVGRLKNYAIIGASLDQLSGPDMIKRANPFLRQEDPLTVTEFSDHLFYQQMNFSSADDFTRLAEYVQQVEHAQGLPGNRIIYVAAAANFYSSITEYLAKSGLARKSTTGAPWQRIVYEKPFGHDLPSAHAINECIARYFDESQIYRIDHYLTKELVGNIVLVRFTNLIFEPLWNNRYIDTVQIILSEQEGIEDRGVYYDRYGASKDMMQNHMLELLALIGMESPEKLTGEHIRAERAKVLAKVRVVDAVLGQYEGYRQEKAVPSDSHTETFVAAQLMIDNPRWAGVPFYLKTGKCLDKKESLIHIKFKQVDCLLTRNCPSESNSLTIRVAPDSTFFLTLNAKKLGALHEVIPVQMEFCHNRIFGQTIPESYEVIFEELLRGEHSIAVRFDEIESAWKVIDAISTQKLPVHPYQKGSAGPQEAVTFALKHGIRWRS